MAKEKKNAGQVIKENMREFGSQFSDTVTNEKKSNRVLVIFGLLVVILLISGFFMHRDSDKDETDTTVATEENQGIYEDEDINDDTDITVTEYEENDSDVTGMWGDATAAGYKTLSDFEGGNWVAYSFDESGSVIRAIGDKGQTITESGTWSTSGDGLLSISWLDSSGEVFYTQEMEYTVTDNKLILDNEKYAPIKEATIFS